MLHTLVSAINYNGCPLFSATVDGDPKPFIASLEDGQPIHNRFLNAVTALLVRNHENIATVINGSYEQVLALQQSNNPEQLEDSDSSTEDESDDTARRPSSLSSNNSTSFTTVANPLHTDTYVSTKNYKLVESGTSHRQHFGKWDELLNIS